MKVVLSKLFKLSGASVIEFTTSDQNDRYTLMKLKAVLHAPHVQLNARELFFVHNLAILDSIDHGE